MRNISIRRPGAVSVVVLSVLALLGVSARPALAGGNDYPYAGHSWSEPDPWRFYKRECVSFVAWRLNQVNRFPFANDLDGDGTLDFRDAHNWADAARRFGFRVDRVPAPGAVAWWRASDARPYGHVAWVEGVGAGVVVIEDSNGDSRHTYSRRTIPAGEPDAYIHFKDLPNSRFAGGWHITNRRDGLAENVFSLGLPGDVPLVGDWNGDGIDTPGIFRGGHWHLSDDHNDTAERVFSFGLPGDIPLAGDWNGDGRDTPAVFRGGQWHLNNGFDGAADDTIHFGVAGDLPLVGDWNGDRHDTPAIVRGGIWHLNNGYDSTADDFLAYGLPNDLPVPGDWNGDGVDTPGVYRGGIWHLNDNFDSVADDRLAFGLPGDIPMPGDWDGNRSSTPGIAR